jgi:intein/homing endonuclease
LVSKKSRENNKKKMKNMKESIESGTEWIEDPVDLNLDIDNLRFESVEDLTIEEMANQKVYDLEVDNQHNYIVDGLGLVHNGGGK